MPYSAGGHQGSTPTPVAENGAAVPTLRSQGSQSTKLTQSPGRGGEALNVWSEPLSPASPSLESTQHGGRGRAAAAEPVHLAAASTPSTSSTPCLSPGPGGGPPLSPASKAAWGLHDPGIPEDEQHTVRLLGGGDPGPGGASKDSGWTTAGGASSANCLGRHNPRYSEDNDDEDLLGSRGCVFPPGWLAAT